MEQYARICPDARWIVDEVGDTTVGRAAHEKAVRILDVLQYLARRDDVEAAVIFLAAGGTDEWREHFLPAEDLARIAEGMEAARVAPKGGTAVQYATIGNGFRVVDRRGDLLRNGSYPRRDLGLVKWIAIHHAGTPGDCSAEAIANYHVNTNGWPGPGYALLVHPDGTAELLNDLDRACFNVAYRNAEVIGICLAGDFYWGVPTAAALATARRVVAELQYTLGWFCPAMGHGEIADPRSPTSCPGATWPQWKPAVEVLKPDSTVQLPPAYRYVLGFQVLAARLGIGVIGQSQEDERRVSLMRQGTNRGIMLYEDGGQPEFYAKV